MKSYTNVNLNMDLPKFHPILDSLKILVQHSNWSGQYLGIFSHATTPKSNPSTVLKIIPNSPFKY